MEIQHDLALKQRLNELYVEGSCFISWQELLLWFNAERVGKSVYRTIQAVWAELLASRAWKTDLPLEVRGAKTPSSGGIRLVRQYAPWMDGDSKPISAFTGDA